MRHDATLAGAVDAASRRWESKPAMVAGSTVLTYGHFGRLIDRIVGVYSEEELQAGDRVVCQLPNGPLHLAVATATWRYGAVHVVADSDLAPNELARRVIDTQAVAIAVQPTDDAAIVLLRSACPQLRILMTGGSTQPAGCYSLSELLASASEATGRTDEDRLAPDPDDAAVILFTSGSTGRPKGVVRYHGQLLEQWLRAAEVLNVRAGDVHLGQLPLSHGFGLGMATMALMTGGKLVLLERFSAEVALRFATTEKVTILHGTPSHFTMLVDHLDPTRHDVSSLRIGQGSAGGFSPGLLRRVFEELGMDLMLLYGCSEGLNTYTTDRQDMLLGSVGAPPPGRVQIVDQNRRALSPMEVGEIAMRRVHRFGYWGEDTPGSDWYYTGDLGRMDADMRLYVLGRVHYQINRGGIRITPEEVEANLAEYPGLVESAVIGVPDRVVGEVVCACVVPTPGTTPTLADVRRFLGQSLARHKLPEELCVLHAIPRAQLGKIDRSALRRLTTTTERERLHPA